MNLKQLFISLIVFCFSCSSSKKLDNKIENLISKLSEESFQIETNYAVSLKIVDENALELEKLGKEISENLLNVFLKDDKTIIVHLLLTKIWESDLYFLKLNYKECLDNSESVISEYTVNNLSWNLPCSGNKFTFDKVERNKIYKYWLSRINEYKKYASASTVSSAVLSKQ